MIFLIFCNNCGMSITKKRPSFEGRQIRFEKATLQDTTPLFQTLSNSCSNI